MQMNKTHNYNRFNVCWDITSQCNEHCLFCYRNSQDSDLPLNDNFDIFKNLADNGADKISFTGGEPLLYSRIFELAQMGKAYCIDIKLSLTTNGLLLAHWDEAGQCFIPNADDLKKIAVYFDWIALPLDAPNAALQGDMTRNALHYDRVIFLIDYIHENYPKLKIKINTLISKVNYHAIPELFSILKHKGIQRWKLFDFMPSRGCSLYNKNQFYISEEIFNRVCASLDIHSAPHMKVTFNSYQHFKDAYFYVSSDGFLVKFDGKSYKKVADCRKDLSSYLDNEGENISCEGNPFTEASL